MNNGDRSIHLKTYGETVRRNFAKNSLAAGVGLFLGLAFIRPKPQDAKN